MVSIQQKSGGNLSEAQGNLTKVLRDRKKMREKIQAMSKDANPSAVNGFDETKADLSRSAFA